MPIENKELLEEAEDLEIDTDDYEDEESLQKIVDEKKANKDKKEKDPNYLESELKKVISQRDSAKKDKRALKKKIEDLESKMTSSLTTEELESLKEEIEELREFRKAAEEKEEEESLKNKTALEKAEINFNKQLEAFKKKTDDEFKKFQDQLKVKETELQKREVEVKDLRKVRAKNEILDVATKMKAYNPSQIVKLLIGDFSYDEDLDTFVYHVKDEKGKLIDEKSVEERVREFLEDPDNDNLIESTVNKGGTDSDKNLDTVDNKNKLKRNKDSKYDPNSEKIKNEAMLRDMKPEELIAIWEMRDVRLSKIGKKE